MPPYSDLPAGVGAITAGPTALVPGDRLTLFNNETVTPGTPSIVVARALGRTDADQGISFFLEFAAAPTASIEILGSNKEPASVFNLNDWVALYTSTNKQQDAYTDNNPFTYYCVYPVSQSAGGKLTAIAQR